MSTTFGKIATELTVRIITAGPEPSDCEVAMNLVTALQAWISVNCPIAKLVSKEKTLE